MAQYLGDRLPSPPADGITRVRFSAHSDKLLVSSWDATLRLYQPGEGLRSTCNLPAPALDCCFHSDTSAVSSALDGQVTRFDLTTGQQEVIGGHAAGVKCVECLSESGLVVSGGWDQSLRTWDPRQAPAQRGVAAVNLKGKVYTMSASPNRLVVGTSNRHIYIFDLRRIPSGAAAEQERESSLKYQTRAIGCYPDGSGYALGSVEGRVAMEYFDMGPSSQALKYAFKCHRRNEGRQDMVYPVNAIAFHPLGTFATGGGDGVVNIWDGANKKRLFQISQFPTSVASMSFSRDGTWLAVASSYCFEFGEREHPADELFLRRVQDAEVRPKPRRT